VRAVRVAALSLAVLALTPALSGANATRQVSGLRGVVMQGPTKPVCRENERCEEAAPGLELRFARAGKAVARVRTDQRGKFSVRLRPGVYSVSLPRSRPGTELTPHSTRVPRGRVARVTFHVDTGVQ
jgi:hypothetical protein